MTSIINWLLSNLPIIKTINGYKTQASFIVWLSTYLAEGLLKAAQFFPSIAPAAQAVELAVSKFLELVRQASEYGILVGVGHKAIKDNVLVEASDKAIEALKGQ